MDLTAHMDHLTRRIHHILHHIHECHPTAVVTLHTRPRTRECHRTAADSLLEAGWVCLQIQTTHL